MEVVRKGCEEELTVHLDSIDTTGSIKFTYEEESYNSLPFLDTLMIRKEDGTVKLLVYRKKTYTDQYLNFTPHHPLHQKLGITKTLLDRCSNIISEPEDREKEAEHITKAKDERTANSEGKNKEKKDKNTEKSKDMVSLPCVKGMVTLPCVKDMVTLPCVKGMVTLLCVKGMVTLRFVKDMVTLPCVKDMVTLPCFKGMVTLPCVKGVTETIQRILKSLHLRDLIKTSEDY